FTVFGRLIGRFIWPFPPARLAGESFRERPMTTLYELLGALPQDDKEDLKRKFHLAVKATHPDAHPGDPDASLRFRQIVRAHAILSDAELKAAYDKMLAFEGGAPGRGIRSRTVAKIVPDTIAISVLAILMLGGYALFAYLSQASVAAIRSVDVAAVARPPAPVARPEAREAPARTEPNHETVA